MRLAAPVIALLTGVSCANQLKGYSDLLKGEPAATAPHPGSRSVSITYLGVNGYLLRSGGTTILVDPYFSRFPLRKIALNAPLEPQQEAIAYIREKGKIPDHIDAYLVTHCHFDHLYDVPTLQKELGGKVIVSETGYHLCVASGVDPGEIIATSVGKVHRIGSATIEVLPAEHDLVLGKVPYQGEITRPFPPGSKPERVKDWKLGTPMAFVIEMGGQRIYVESGGIVGSTPSVRDLDVAILGVGVGKTDRYIDAVRKLKPRFVLASHQDDFFTRASSGFHFNPLANFPAIVTAEKSENLPGELLLMEYFNTWTLPDQPKEPPVKREPSPMAKFKTWLRELLGTARS
jgi:L-ascorbate metabolism protein UlaG (beta-lactamase superfamily)